MPATPIPAAPSPGATAANPKPRDEDLDFFGITDRGLVRKDNQDHFLVTTLHKTMRVHVTSLPNPELLEIPSQRIASVGMVCDGVGGHAGGEAASRSAVEAIAGYVTHTMQCFFTGEHGDPEEFLVSLRDAATRSHELIATRARESGDRKGMATTLTMFVAVWPILYLLQDLLDSGVLTPEQAARSPYANVLSSSLGGATWVPEVSRFDLKLGDKMLLCTDGLTKHVSDEQIERRMEELTSSEQAARALLKDALDGGGTDNVTVLVLRTIIRP
jgi:serine/threonine protein phosphatase PrpC